MKFYVESAFVYDVISHGELFEISKLVSPAGEYVKDGAGLCLFSCAEKFKEVEWEEAFAADSTGRVTWVKGDGVCDDKAELVFAAQKKSGLKEHFKCGDIVRARCGKGVVTFDKLLELMSDSDALDAYENEKAGLFYTENRPSDKKRLFMWLEQYVNAGSTNTLEKLEALMQKADEAGITDFCVDLKGCEGYAAYKKTTYSKAPYMTETINPKKQIEMEFDFLEEFITAAHRHGKKVLGSFNFFVEGNISAQDYAMEVPKKHRDWAEVLQAPEDKGALVSVLDSKRNSMLLYVNPANCEVCELQRKRVREVLENYDIDGIILDRTRYDNQYADFGDVSRVRFEEFLSRRGKKLQEWPQDVYTFAMDGEMVFGSLYIDWLTFRSSIIKEFAFSLREIVDAHNKENKKKVELAAYVGSWFELYYQNGVNWSSKNFKYRQEFDFPLPQLYTQEYAKTSYTDAIDFLMTGCYYDNAEEIRKYAALGRYVTNGELPVFAAISLPHLKTQELLDMGVKECLQGSDGLMIFDLCYTDWDMLSKAIKRSECVI